VGTIHSTASVREAADLPQQDEGDAHGRHWSAPSSTSRRRSLRRAGNASGGGDVEAKEFGAQGASARKTGSERKAKSRTSARCMVLKGTCLTLHLPRRARRVNKTSARLCVRPGETAARNCNASIPATCRLAEPKRGLDGAVISVTSAEIPAPMTAPTSSLRP
jgi:hypothetical protein